MNAIPLKVILNIYIFGTKFLDTYQKFSVWSSSISLRILKKSNEFQYKALSQFHQNNTQILKMPYMHLNSTKACDLYEMLQIILQKMLLNQKLLLFFAMFLQEYKKNQYRQQNYFKRNSNKMLIMLYLCGRIKLHKARKFVFEKIIKIKLLLLETTYFRRGAKLSNP
ncbi:hypothetical protein pb186bvf_019823 [Paramecium bursaria]